MLYANEFEAFISINGKEVPHYGIQLDERAKQMSCWIAAEPGQKYAINWACCTNDLESRGDVYINRDKIGCEYITRPNWNLSLEKRMQHLSVRKSKSPMLNDLVFSTNTDFNSKYEPEIQVRVYSLAQGASKRIRNDSLHKNNILRAPHPSENDTSKLIRKMTFTFKYRSIDFLQSEGITTRPPSIINPFPRRESNSGGEEIPSAIAGKNEEISTSGTIVDELPTQDGQKDVVNNLQLSEGHKRKRDLVLAETAPHTDEELMVEISDLKKRLDELYLIQSYRKRASAQSRVRVPKQIPFERQRNDWYKYLDTDEPVGKKRRLVEDEGDEMEL